MNIEHALDQNEWDAFLARQPWRPFLQSWTMGEVYGDIGQKPVRLLVKDAGGVRGICFAHVVPARRGKHLAIPYGPLFDYALQSTDFDELLPKLFGALEEEASKHGCSFIRFSPFLAIADGESLKEGLTKAHIKAISSPLHLLAEHVWHLPLTSEDAIKAGMRKTTRNLIGRAERDGVTVEASKNPTEDLESFITLHDETRRRHGFTPYTDAFFRSQVKRFASRNECTVYLARYQGNVIASSVHMHAFGETSYHHGSSSREYSKIPASYLLQWTAIRDALRRRDKTYNFWGIAPTLTPNPSPEGGGASSPLSPIGGKGPGDRGSKNHPFAGVTLFKTGFGGELLNLMHCHDIPVKPSYWITYGFEQLRKWRRGF